MCVLGFNEKSSPRMEIQGTKEEEKSSLADGSDLLIWGECNRRIFKDEELSYQRLRVLFFGSLVEWSRQLLDLEIPSHLNFLETIYCG